MTESVLMRYIMGAVGAANCRIFRSNAGSFRSSDGQRVVKGLPKGFPDLFGFDSEGKIFFIECKVKPNKPTPEQLNFIAMAKKFNCKAGVAYSVEEALAIVKGERL